MSSKLTKERLNSLIKDLLRERKSEVDIELPPAPIKRKFKYKTKGSTIFPGLDNDDFEDLSVAGGDETDIDLTDLDVAFHDPNASANAKSAAETIAQDGISPYDDIAQSVKAAKAAEDIDAVDPSQSLGQVKSKDIKSIAFKSLQTISADPASSNTNLGSFPKGIATATQVFFKDETTFIERINKVNQISAFMGNPPRPYKSAYNQLKGLLGGKDSDVLAGIIFLDYLATLSREVDSGAAAYMFESFLAMMMGGRVTGKDNKATDFVTNLGINGSCKYYSSTSDITQSASGFEINEPYVYIIAIKTGAKTIPAQQPSATRMVGLLGTGESNPRDIHNLQLYVLTVVTPDKSNFYIKTRGGKIVHQQVPAASGAKLKFDHSSIKTAVFDQPINIQIARKLKKTVDAFNQTVLKVVGDSTNKSTQAARGFIKAAEAVYNIDQDLQAYASTGNKTSGNKVLKDLLEFERSFENLASGLHGKTKFKADKKAKKLEENKTKSLKDLDKLIERVILESMNKK